MSEQPTVEIYTKEYCGFCVMAKDLLDEKGVEYTEYVVTGDEERFTEMVERAAGKRTAPQVFIDDELIGGWDETSALNETGELDERLGLAVEDDGTVGSDEVGASAAEGSVDGQESVPAEGTPVESQRSATDDARSATDDARSATDGGRVTDEEIEEHRRMIIAGSGIAGLTAAIYAGRANNDPLVLEGDEPGGQLTLTTDVANYPGFPEGIGGPELINEMKAQAERFGAEVRHGIVTAVDDDRRPFRVELRNGDVYTTDVLIAASGASARTLDVPGQDELMGYGLSTCATCDGAFFRGEDMLVVGGGDAAMEEAAFLTKFADTVHLVHRREGFRAEDYWIDRIMEHVEDGDVEIHRNTELLELHGTREDGIDHVTLAHNPEGYPSEKLEDPETEVYDFEVGAVFYAIGHTPNTEYLADTGVELDEEGYLTVRGGEGGGQMATAVEGIFGAGDVVDFHYQQAVTAAGLGCMAAMDADDYLDELDRGAAGDVAGEPAAADDD